MHNVNDLFVEINGELFPACNIQIPETFPELMYNHEHRCFYGVYFEMMFETGWNLTIWQEAFDTVNWHMNSVCTEHDLDHFIVELTSVKDGYLVLIYTWHCIGIDALVDVLRRQRILLSEISSNA